MPKNKKRKARPVRGDIRPKKFRIRTIKDKKKKKSDLSVMS